MWAIKFLLHSAKFSMARLGLPSSTQVMRTPGSRVVAIPNPTLVGREVQYPSLAIGGGGLNEDYACTSCVTNPLQ